MSRCKPMPKRCKTCPAVLMAILLLCSASLRQGRPAEPAEVHGRVTLAGKPLVGACVFTPTTGGRESSGQTDADGRYTLRYLRDVIGTKVGPHKVAIITAIGPNAKERLPTCYDSQTTLTANVQPGGKDIDFDLKLSPQ